MREYAKSKVIDRSEWPPGPWDNEPDYYEWTTEAGYEAYTCRLMCGAWVGIIIAPYPTDGMMLLAFSHTMRDKRFDQLDHQPGMISKTDQEGIGEFCLSMEHWESPGPASYRPIGGPKFTRGPYKTLEEVKQICENVAADILETHTTQSYKDYFKR